VTRKSIATNMAVVSCDVCGRTLLRGENADIFLAGGSRRTVCELCTSRAVHEGWIREGLDDVSSSRSPERGRSFLQRLRQRRERPERDPVAERAPRGEPRVRPAAPAPPAYEPEYDDHPYESYEPAAGVPADPYAGPPEADAPAPVPAAAPQVHAPAPAPAPIPAEPPADVVGREPRSVHAVPTNAQMKVARALEVFNAGSYPRTVAGVSRSLGAPIVCARPSLTEGSIVTIVVGWELSWYRYEVDLGDEAAGVRVTAQGSELTELEPADQRPNAAADEHGRLHLVAGHA
jgi:hypothetical protein